jgi:hypothetical protein
MNVYVRDYSMFVDLRGKKEREIEEKHEKVSFL